ncbi:MAG: TlyA family RNA methyltransferase [Anaerolineales bacterium]
MAKTERVDTLLVNRGFAKDLSQAKRMVMAGEVRVEGQLVHKPSMSYSPEVEITLDQGPPYVSRGGEKLAAALAHFEIPLAGRVCADVGASTGGFTDCLLQHGAKKVYAIDVGYGLLDWNLRQDERVVVMERTNARYLYQLPESVAVITMDASFISLDRLLPVSVNWFSPEGGETIALVKPQFEAYREEAAVGEGVIDDRQVHLRVVEEVSRAAQEMGYGVRDILPSPLRGSKGNQEYLVWYRYPGEPRDDLEAFIRSAVPDLR